MPVSTTSLSLDQIDAAIARVVEDMAPDVIRVRYSVGEDWAGSPAIFFRVVLSDNASRPSRLRRVTRQVSAAIGREVNPLDFGLEPYFNYRSASEQAELREEAWA